jgi:hypothetical protein
MGNTGNPGETEDRDDLDEAVRQPEQPEKEEPKAGTAVVPQQGMVQCAPCKDAVEAMADAAMSATTTFVYALGRVQVRFPNVSVEKELAQATGRADTAGQTDSQALHSVLSQRENRYIARQLCWIMTVQGLETYILQTRDAADVDLLIEALRPAPSPGDVDAVIGVKGPLAPAQLCNGLMVPIVIFDQIYSFDSEALVKSIPRPDSVSAKEFGAAAKALFERIMQLTDNSGATDDYRALNYLAMRYPAIYTTALDCHGKEMSLTAVDTRLSRLTGARKIVDTIFTYTHRKTDVSEKFFVRVDVTEEFPFLVSKISQYFDH